MPHKQIKYKPIGMNRDLSISAANPKYAHTITNMRIINNEETGDLSLTNERGTEFITSDSGIILGSVSTIDKQVLFCTNPTQGYPDSIYLFNGTELTKLYWGNLGFSIDHPIEGLYSYDNNLNEKIYWTDGLNQPRVINLKGEIGLNIESNTQFDFVSPIDKPFVIDITKNYTGGTLSPGVIQYVFTYIGNHGQESNIFHTTPLWYVSHNDRGASAEEVVPNSFKIQIQNNSLNKERVAVYSIQRTSLNTTPLIRRVGILDIEAGEESSIIDKGQGESLEASSLYYIGGENIICGTLNQKDGTLFLGDITLDQPFIEGINNAQFRECADKINISYKQIKISNEDSVYPYKNQLDDNSYGIKTFKYLEYYRLGVQLQHKTGKWSNPIFITDYYITGKIDDGNNFYDNTGKDTYIKVPKLTLDLHETEIINYINNLLRQGYINIRPVIVYPDLNDRESICQGVLCPTVFNLKERYDGTTFSQASWFFRPNIPTDITTGEDDYVPFDKSATDEYTYSRSGLVANDDNLLLPDTGNIGQEWQRLRGIINRGAWAEFRHLSPIPGNDKRNAEIQCIFQPLQILKNSDTPSSPDTKTIVDENSECYYVDQSIVTMHSPDIEFDQALQNIDLKDTKLRIVGLVPITSNISDIDIKTSSHTGNVGSTRGSGFYHTTFESTNDFQNIKAKWEPHWGYRMMLSGFFWYDYKYVNTDSDDIPQYGGYETGKQYNIDSDIEFPFAVYPWHRNGSLNNMRTPINGFRSSMLKTKRMSNLRYSYRTAYFNENSIKSEGNWSPNTAYPEFIFTIPILQYDLSDAQIFNSKENQILKLNKQHDSLEDIIYRGNIDSVVVPSLQGEYRISDLPNNMISKYDKNIGYPIIYGDKLFESDNYNKQDTFRAPYYYFAYTDKDTHRIVYASPNQLNTGIDPVQLKYKSSPHLVLPLKYHGTGNMRILPTIKEKANSGYQNINGYKKTVTTKEFWLWDEKNKLNTDVIQMSILSMTGDLLYPEQTLGYGWLWLGELYRENVEQRFGGTSPDALANNNWQVAGETVSLQNISGEHVVLEWVEGDTFYQRYDCLKTYPYSSEDQNQNTEILSFMCETRINLDGRYDRNRGLDSNLTVSPTNFNLLNDAYSQSNNYFNYSILKKEQFDISRFPNQITWTKTKQQGQEIDNWTNITLASTIDLDGDKGKITSIQKLNNNIIVFQDKGVSQLLYNEKVHVNTQDGVPIEIANSGKVDGYRVLSDIYGCANKWSIQNTKKGLYFIDDYNKDIVFFNGQFKSLSREKGFNSWISNYINSTSQAFTQTTPSEFGNIITHYDKVTDDIYFVTANEALNYSEVLDEFQAFLSYGSTCSLFNLKGQSYLVSNIYDFSENSYHYEIYEMYKGDYNYLLNTQCAYGIELLVNPEPTEDKVFNTIEFRADSWERGNELSDNTFNRLDVETEHQRGTSSLEYKKGYPSTLKRKFRIWRANIPRDTSYTTLSSYPTSRNRIRNTWAKVGLWKFNSDKEKTVLHDIQVSYFV